MKDSSLLVISPDKNFLDSSKDIFLLGQWCNTLDFEKFLSKKNIDQLSHHWTRQSKRAKDYLYLTRLNNDITKQLVRKLNLIHKTNFSESFWRKVIGPWLASYLPLIYDRWEIISDLEKINKKFHTYDYHDKKTLSPETFDNFQSEFIHNDYWNHRLFIDIIEFKSLENIDLKVIEKVNTAESRIKRAASTSLREKFKCLIDPFLSVFDFKPKILIYGSQLSIKDLILLSIKLGQIPRLYSFLLPKKNGSEISRNKIIRLNKTKLKKKSFEEFLYQRIFMDMPQSYLENFNSIYSLKKKFNGKVIYTSNAHLHNDFFNIWSARKVEEEQVVLITGQHGGAIKSSNRVFDHEETISIFHVVWHKLIKPQQVRLPSISKFLKFSSIDKRSDPRSLLLIGYEVGSYIYSAQSGPVGNNIMRDFDQKIKFISHLNKKIFNALEISVKKYEGIGNYFCSYSRYRDAIPEVKIHSDACTKHFNDANIIVCTYPQTTFLEAMLSGVPTILLYRKEDWALDKNFDDLIKRLVENNILFFSAKKASEHINSIWNNPVMWWNNSDVIAARNLFFSECFENQDYKLDKWANFFNEVYTNKRLS